MSTSNSLTGLTGICVRSLAQADRTRSAVALHQHTEVELIVYDHGPATMLFGGRRFIVPPQQMAVFWGAMPHHAMDAKPEVCAYVVRVPMPVIINWTLPAWLMQQLFEFQVLLEPLGRSPCSDLDLLKHWVRLLESHSMDAARIVLLEVEGRLRRMALDRHMSTVLAPRLAAAGSLEKMVGVIVQRCLGHLSVSEVAREAGITRFYAMRIFRRQIGITMLEYITRQRVSHAQRLLATTDRGVLDVMQACGFASPTRFYAVFCRYAGCTPARYRRLLRH